MSMGLLTNQQASDGAKPEELNFEAAPLAGVATTDQVAWSVLKPRLSEAANIAS